LKSGLVFSRLTFPQRSPETENRKTQKLSAFRSDRVPPIIPQNTSTCPRCGMIHDRRYTTGRSVSRKEARGWGTQVYAPLQRGSGDGLSRRSQKKRWTDRLPPVSFSIGLRNRHATKVLNDVMAYHSPRELHAAAVVLGLLAPPPPSSSHARSHACARTPGRRTVVYACTKGPPSVGACRHSESEPVRDRASGQQSSCKLGIKDHSIHRNSPHRNAMRCDAMR
jgi:hypothetical protein